MWNFHLEFSREPGLLLCRASGYAPFDKIKHLKQTIINEITAVEKEGEPYRLLFDLRGLKALDPRAAAAIGELQEFLDQCAATKIGTVNDSIIAKMQQMRVDRTSLRKEGRVGFFDDVDECRKWLEK